MKVVKFGGSSLASASQLKTMNFFTMPSLLQGKITTLNSLQLTLTKMD